MYEHFKIIEIQEHRDEKTGEVSLKATVQRVNVKFESLNLGKQSADVINQFYALQKSGNTAMLPVREGTVNGFNFITLTKEPIIELPPQLPSQVSLQSVPSASQPEKSLAEKLNPSNKAA